MVMVMAWVDPGETYICVEAVINHIVQPQIVNLRVGYQSEEVKASR